MIKLGLLSGAVFAGLSIVLGSFGAHALKEQLSAYSMSVYEKAVLYQMFHALAILLLIAISKNIQGFNFDSSIWCFIIGIILFSGSLTFFGPFEVILFFLVTFDLKKLFMKIAIIIVPEIIIIVDLVLSLMDSFFELESI